ncbi:MAG: hypothetical protein PHS48_06130 [Bacteroidales bacterium]|nr:hypothetical protein [Bacteroidales bacterium]
METQVQNRRKKADSLLIPHFENLADTDDALFKMIGKKIIFPTNLHPNIPGRDTVTEVLKKPGYKIITFADAAGCNICRLNFFGWKLLIAESKEWKNPVDFVFIIQPGNELSSILDFYDFYFPIFYDESASFIRKNQLSTDPQLQTFLVDPENKIVLAGYPVAHKILWNRYKKIIENPS